LKSIQGGTEEGFTVEKNLDNIFFTECSSLFNAQQGKKEPGINLLYSSTLNSPVTHFN